MPKRTPVHRLGRVAEILMKHCLIILSLSAFAQLAAAQDAQPAAAAPAAAATTKPQPAVKPAAKKPASADRLDLETTVVTGNRELPKVLYIVPWKKAELGELPAQPFNTLLDEVLQPVDRDVFRR